MQISLIVAVSNNHVIGIDNKLPWHLPADLQYFKSLTIEHPIIMGRKTYESIGRALPKRENIVITRDKTFQAKDLIIQHTIEDALQYCETKEYNEVFIIGGDNIYQQTIGLATKLYITKVDVNIENGTAFFPQIDNKIWKLVNRDARKKDEKNIYDYTFEVYEKRSH